MISACAQRLDMSVRICTAFNDCRLQGSARLLLSPKREDLPCQRCRNLHTYLEIILGAGVSATLKR